MLVNYVYAYDEMYCATKQNFICRRPTLGTECLVYSVSLHSDRRGKRVCAPNMDRMNVREVDETMEFLRNYISRPAVVHSTFRQVPHASGITSPTTQFRNAQSDGPLSPSSSGGVWSSSMLPPNLAARSSPAQQQQLLHVPPGHLSPAPGSLTTSASVEQKLQFMAVLSFLRKRYLPAPILDAPSHSDNFANSLGSLSDTEVTTMLEAFSREARGVLHKERTWQLHLRDGSSRRVNFPPQDLLHESVSHPKSPPPSPPPAGERSTHGKQQKDSDDDDEAPSAGTKPLRSKRRVLKDGMKMMRVGEGVVKFSTSGKPQRRCLRVEDRKARSTGGDTVTVPHLCWSESANAEPSATGQLSLLTLQAVQHKKLSGAVQRDRTGVVRDDIGEAVSVDCCLSLSFERRGSLDVVFRSPELAKKWSEALQLVIDKNSKLKSKGELE